jgi:hypothetical protein
MASNRICFSDGVCYHFQLQQEIDGGYLGFKQVLVSDYTPLTC